MIDTLLITGAGGDIALSIARFLREDGVARRIVGADLRDDHAGFAFYDEVVRLPRADAADYFKEFDALVKSVAPDLVIPMSEAELERLLAEGRIGEDPRLLTANAHAIWIGLDKLKTFSALDAAGIGVPRTGEVGVSAAPSLPCIVKMRKGQGSKGLTLAEPWNWNHFATTRAGWLWQEYLPDAEHEYTCGLVRLPGMGTRTIVLRRKLAGGLTGSASVVHNPRIDAELRRVADVLDLNGAVNVQLRLLDGAPRIFEINPRFSSTAGFRHRMGFRDVLWSIEHRIGRPVSPYIPPREGTAMYRVGSEVIREPQQKT